MAQWDVVLTQNVHATLVEYTERNVTMAKGVLISADASNVPTILPAGTDGYQLVRDDLETTGLKWQVIAAGHTQNTDTGTTQNPFALDSDGFDIELTAASGKFEVRASGGATFVDFEAKDATFAKVTVAAAPVAGSDLTNKTYVDGILASNDAMVYKGTVGTGGTYTIVAFNALTTYNAGDTYKVIEAGTIKGSVCEIGDMLIAIVDRTGAGAVDADWTVVQANIDGAVVGPASATDGNIATFSGASGKVIQDGGVAVSDLLQLSVFTAAGQILYSTGSAAVAALAAGTSGQVLQSGGAGAPSWLTVGTMITADQADFVANTLFDANTILAANVDNTPLAVTVAASTILGRTAAGNIDALTPAEAMGVLFVTAPGAFNSDGTQGQIAWDEDYFYICSVTGSAGSGRWIRTPMATNW